MTRLIYTGDGNWIPSWPTADHDEDSPEQVEAKLASGLYRTESGQEKKDAAAAAREAKKSANQKAAELAEQAAEAARLEADALTTKAREAVAEAEQATEVALSVKHNADARRKAAERGGK